MGISCAVSVREIFFFRSVVNNTGRWGKKTNEMDFFLLFVVIILYIWTLFPDKGKGIALRVGEGLLADMVNP